MDIKIVFSEGQLALAAYAFLNQGDIAAEPLANIGMADSQALRFAADWTVVDQFNSNASGLSATVFQEVSTGKRYLAVRGTQDLLDLQTDLIHIFAIGTPLLTPQYILLRIKVQQWLASGVLPLSFTVTGHSLGGFLATGIAAEFAANVEHAYLYNAPGLNGVFGSATAPILQALGVESPIAPEKISNIKADAGISPIAGLGMQVAPPLPIFIENQFLSDVANSPVAKNHSQQVLTDSLALYAAFQSLDDATKSSDISSILKRVSPLNALTLEAGLDLLGGLFQLSERTIFGDRDSYYRNLASIQGEILQGGFANSFQLQLLSNASETYLKAQQDSPLGLAYRYALKTLSPVAFAGTSSIYAEHNANNRFDLFDRATGNGLLTDQWLRDRAELLIWKNLKYERDLGDGISLFRKDFGAESYLFTEMSQIGAAASGLSIRVVGSNPLQLIDPIRITFGTEDADSLQGGKYGDHLYGEGGDDSLSGGEGDDYLEGGLGSDTYVYLSADGEGGYDTILDVDGQGSISFDGHVLSGGRKAQGNRYQSEDGLITYSFAGSIGAIGSLIVNDVLEVQNFRNGSLGITLAIDEVQHQTSYEILYLHGLTVEGEGITELSLLGGSDQNDEYWTGVWIDHEFIPGPGLTDESSPGITHHFYGKAGNDVYLGARASGFEKAWGGPGADELYGAALGEGPGDTGGDRLSGGAGQDYIIGGTGNDYLYGDFDVLIPGGTVAAPNAYLGADAYVYSNLATGDFTLVWDYKENEPRDNRFFVNYQDVLNYVLGIDVGMDWQTLYDDWMEAGLGDDFLMGGNGSDSLFGEEGDDLLIGDVDLIQLGDSYDQLGFGDYAYLFGRPGDDWLDGGDGNDVMAGGIGSDTLYGGAGDDDLTNQDNLLEAGLFRDGNAPLEAAYTNFLDGGEGDDRIVSRGIGVDTIDQIFGGSGDDEIVFSGGKVFIDGGEGNDQIATNSGTVIHVEAGDGDDVLSVGGVDIEVSGGAGSDTISAAAQYLVVDQTGNSETDHDVLTLIELSSYDVLLSRNGTDLVISTIMDWSTVILEGWFEGAEYQFAEIQLADGVTWSPQDVEQVLAHNPRSPENATQGDDVIFASALSPIADGLDGNDIIVAQANSAVLMGGDGSDGIFLGASGFAAGGSGADGIQLGMGGVVAFNRGDGEDVVELRGGTISLGGGIVYGEVSVTASGEDLIIATGFGDSLRLIGAMLAPEGEGQLAPLRLQIISDAGADIYDLRNSLHEFHADSAIGGVVAKTYAQRGALTGLTEESIAFALGDAQFDVAPQAFRPISRSAPLVFLGVADQDAQVGAEFEYTLPEYAFLDLDSDAVPTIFIAQQDGGTLPPWLRYDSLARRLSGIPTTENIGEISLRVSAMDSDGLSTSDLLRIVVTDPPVHSEAPASGLPDSEQPVEDASDAVPDGSGETPSDDPLVHPEGPGPGLSDPEYPVVDVSDVVPNGSGVMPSDRLIVEEDDVGITAMRGIDTLALKQALEPTVLRSWTEPIPSAGLGSFGGNGISAGKLVPADREAVDAIQTLLAQEVEAQTSAQSQRIADERVITEQPELQAGVDAIQTLNPGLSSWEIAFALMNFHLEGTGDGAAGSDFVPLFWKTQSLLGMSLDSAQEMIGVPGFGSDAHNMQVFAGLQEGFARLS